MRTLAGDKVEKQVVFVSGVQRSGTNMVMEVLDRSMETDVFMETDRRAFDHYEMRDISTIRRLVARSGSGRVVIKALLEAHRLAGLMEAFAPAKAIWIFRAYEDMVNSYMANWPGGRNQLDAIVRERTGGNWRANGMTDETLEIVRRHYRPEMNDASALAVFWHYRNQLYFDQGLDRDPRVMLLQYESMVTEPEEYVCGIAQFLGVRPTKAMIGIISPASVRKRPPPDIAPDVRALCEAMYRRLVAVWGRQRRAS
jgi:hypothetical protein